MKKVAAVVLSLFAFASSAFAEKFLSVSDIHFDPFADPAIVTKLQAADVAEWDAILATSTATAFSKYGSDANDPLFRSAIGEMQKQIPAPAFVLISGDFLAHKFQQTYQQYATDKSQAAYTAFVTKTIAYVASRFRTAYPGVRIYPTLGNNDSDCGDYAIAPNGAFLANFRDVWSGIVGSRSFDRRFATGGYYHADIPALKNVRLIALNTIFFSTNYKNPCGTPGPDAGLRELEWLDAELLLARAEHKRVWLLFHIPPGADVYDTITYGGACPALTTQSFWKDEYAQKYLAITAAYRTTILGSFAGHTHEDEFRIANGDYIHITPSISPIFGNNPAFEIVDVNPSGAIADYTAWNLPNVTAPWSREFAFDAAYTKPRYDTQALTELAASIHSDPAIRQQYFGYYSSGHAKSTAEALATWQGYWCGLQAMTGPAFTTCYCPPANP
ncbi:MAG: sphingomyelin phosphodiesterase acid-like 3 [Acidobacteriota bacterium]|nr:sphingomyelin phosphodiesterase acid-like 3 [Acidobacteriota bacterium]